MSEKKKNNFNMSVKTGWMKTYLIILLVISSVSMGTFMYARSMLERQLMVSNTLILNGLSSQMDNYVHEILNNATSLMTNQRVLKVIKMSGSLGEADKEVIRELSEDVYNLCRNLADDTKVAVFLKNLDLVVTQNGVLNTEVFYKSSNIDGGMGLQEFKARLYKKRNPYFEKLEMNNERMITYTLPIPLAEKEEKNAVIMIYASEKVFVNNFNNNIQGLEVHYAVVGETKNILSASHKIMQENIENLVELKENTEISIDGEKYFINVKTSNSTGFRYITAIPIGKALKNLIFFEGIFIVLTLLGLLISFVLIFRFVKKNYAPIESIIDNLKQRNVQLEGSHSNEYEIIHKILENMFHENALLGKLLQTNSMQLKENFIHRLLKGKIDEDEDIKEALENYGIRFLGDHYTVAFIQTDGAGIFDSETESHNQQELMIKTIFINIFEELIHQKYSGCVVPYNNMFALVISMKEEQRAQFFEEMQNTFKFARNFIIENFKIPFTVVVSSIYPGIEGIYQACMEAEDAFDYKFILGEKPIINTAQINISSNNEFRYTFSSEKKLINFIKSNDYDSTVAEINEILTPVSSETVPAIENLRSIAFNIVATLIKLSNEISNSSQEYAAVTEQINRMVTESTLGTMKEHILLATKELCNYYAKEAKPSKLLHNVIRYIEKNYNDTNLSVVNIADKLGFNHTYLSTTFKEQMGEGLLEFINKYRVNRSKEVINGEQLTNIEEISMRAGFASPKTYVRVFKKYEGITPAKYIDQILKSGQNLL